MWYALDQAARHYGVAPYELLERDDAAMWISRALTVISAEAQGQQILREKAEQRARMK